MDLSDCLSEMAKTLQAAGLLPEGPYIPSNGERLEEVETNLVTAARIAAVRLNNYLVDGQMSDALQYLEVVRAATETGIQLDKWMNRLTG